VNLGPTLASPNMSFSLELQEGIGAAVGALPYIDTAYADPSMKARVQALLQEEMRSVPYQPEAYSQRLPPYAGLQFPVR
jgi:hypothetical protein